MNTSKKARLLEAFQRGVNLTPAQITSRYGIANPSATVSDLRMTVGVHCVIRPENNINSFISRLMVETCV